MNKREICSLIMVLVLSTLTISCEKNEDLDRSSDFEIYYQDSVDISKFLINSSKTLSLKQSEAIFEVKNNKLFVKDYSAINRTSYNVNINGHNLTIKVKSWINGEYFLKELPPDDKYIMLNKGDTIFYFVGRNLFYSVNNISTLCATINQPDIIYNEMVAEYGVYAIRINNMIYVSSNLKDWKKIYHDKRGIKESMVLIKNENTGAIELLFSEYTPGTIYVRHYIKKYDFNTNIIRAILTFYTTQENISQGLTPYARHIHVLSKDPYTGDIYVGTGDTDEECGIYISSDSGNTFRLLGGGSQMWRTLSFIFTEKSVFWNVDSHETQYLRQLSRDKITSNVKVNDAMIKNFPLINSALWCTLKTTTSDGKHMYIMSSNNEGGIYDNKCRTYGIIFKNEIPIVYDLLSIDAKTRYTQMFPIGIDNNGYIYLCNHEEGRISKYKLLKK